MTRGLAIVAGGILLLVGLLTFAGLGGSVPVKAMIITCAAAGIACLYWWDNRREKKEKERLAAESETRFRELASLAERPQFELAVTGPSNIAIAAGVVAFAGAIVFWGYAANLLPAALMGLVLLVFGVYMLLRVIPAVGKPVVTLSRSGFQTPLSPPLSWTLVDGIHLQTVVIKGRIASHVLVVRIGSLAQHIAQFAPVFRVGHAISTRAGKERISIVLKGAKEQPEVVYRLARLLWTKSTGRDYDWNPNMSEEYNAAFRKLKETADRLQKEQEACLLPPRGPAEVARVMKEIEANGALVEKELRRKARTLKWINYSIVAFVIIYIVIRLAFKKTG